MKPYKTIVILALILITYSCSKNGDPTSAGNNGSSGSGVNVGSSSAVSITDFSPKSAMSGSTITITGTGFGNDVKAIKVAIGSSPFDYPVSVTPTTLVIKTNAATPSGKIAVLINNVTYTSAVDFTALADNLDLNGYQGIDGTNRLGRQIYFDIAGEPDTSGMTFSFGGTAPVRGNYYFAQFQNKHVYGAIIPKYAKEGKVTLSVANKTVLSDFDLKFNLSVADVSPKSFTAGDTVKITGFAFTNINDMSVNFNSTGSNAFVKPIKVTANELLVVVPNTAKSGPVEVSASLGSNTYTTFPDVYTYNPRVSFTDYLLNTSGKVGDVIAIYGDFMNADISKITVSFNGSVPVKPTSLMGSFIYVKIPADAKTGKITITREGYVPLTGSFTFTILP